ncbi:Chimeric ERCC6-PGBD3 protein [Trichinella spiralis]|uniref:Chimeric ERCC6-PGBD3 protein n=1 Tax=Trichinella spiralis TaxID=6334 RepID=A0ABR3KR84_TRISP
MHLSAIGMDFEKALQRVKSVRSVSPKHHLKLQNYYYVKCSQSPDDDIRKKQHSCMTTCAPTADSRSDHSDFEYLPDCPEDEFDPAGKLEDEEVLYMEEREDKNLKSEDLDMIFPVDQLQPNQNSHRMASLTLFQVLLKTVTDKAMDHIVFQSNLYASREGNSRAFRVLQYLQEIRQFIKLILLSGYHCVLETKHYWPTKPDMGKEFQASKVPLSTRVVTDMVAVIQENSRTIRQTLSKKWYWPLFVRAVNVATVAAWQIHCFIDERSHSPLVFRRQGLVGFQRSERISSPRAASGLMSQLPDIQFDGVNHIRGTGPQGCCKECRRDTRNMCTKCSVRVHAVRGKQCFEIYHRQK